MNSERASDLRLVATALVERGQQLATLDGVEPTGEGLPLSRHGRRQGGAGSLERQVRRLDHVAFGEDSRSLHDVLELADVARPVVRLEPRDRLIRDSRGRARVAARVFVEEVLGEEDLEAVTAWVMELRDRESPGGISVGRSGPVSEGFIAWLVGLGLLGIVMYLLGEKAGDTEATDE